MEEGGTENVPIEDEEESSLSTTTSSVSKEAGQCQPEEKASETLPVNESEGDESEEDESEILEESPCGRWLKRREEVSYRDVPGIDCAYLAMDTEEGVEVVWNEATFSEAKKFKAQEDKLKNVFEILTLIEHPNIVKFHKYWTDDGKSDEKKKETCKPRVILITEYMSSGSLKQFLRKTKKNSSKIPLKSWRRWCNQILSALSYLHSYQEPIIHGNLTCDTIFIQHNGLVKIGSVAPDAIHKNVKTFRENFKNFHFLAPEWADDTITLTPAIDIFAFGMCALETAALEITSNAETGGQISQEAIEKCIDSLENEMQKDFIRKCLIKDPLLRPKARDLLFHPALFEVHSLKLLAAHTLVKNPAAATESMTEEAIHHYYSSSTVMASLKMTTGEETEEKLFKLSDFPVSEKLEKFMEDVKFGIFPLTAFASSDPPPTAPRASSPECQKEDKKSEQEPGENRRIVTMQCSLGEADKKDGQLSLRILLRFEDNMNRQLSCVIASNSDSPFKLAEELVQHGFIHPLDSGAIQEMLQAAIMKYGSCGLMELPGQILV
eukprot:GFUD01011960.1.p1 GENE.GFUD01011960.1~~GFUD01011960.1.p1  ORF type:complete len:551 (-),score=163.23 GFUD01011960.1:55-1707(-)